MRFAAIQMQSTPHWKQNLRNAQRWVAEAAKRKCRLVAFPENFLLFAERKQQYLDQAQRFSDPLASAVQLWARKYRVWILAGSLPFRSPNKSRVYNRSVLFNSSGKVVSYYDKIHLFDADVPEQSSQKTNYRESRMMVPGKQIKVARTPLGNLGLSICYDLRFPELYRQLSRRGSEVLFAPSAFTIPTGKAHWDSLTRARAIENQCYVICPGQVGTHYSGRKTYGHTRIVDPWGEVLAEKKSGSGMILAEVDLKHLRRIRKKLPALKHRKLL